MTDVRIVDDQSKLWAQEYTLLRLVDNSTFTNDILLKFAKQYLKSDDIDKLGERTTAAADKNTDELGRRIKETGDRSDLQSEMSARRYEYAVSNLKDSLVGSLSDIGTSLNSADPGSIFKSISNNLDSANRQFDGMSTGLSKVVAGLAVAAKIIEMSYERFSQLNESFVQSYSSGVKFANGLNGLNRAVGESGLSVAEFTGIMNKHSQSFNVLGGRRVPEINKEFLRITENGSQLTMTLAQSQEGLMAYADIMRMSGRLQRMTNGDIAVGAKRYLQSINDLSYASGRSREELMASTKDVMSRPEFQAFLASLDEGAKANLEQSVTSLAAFGSEIQGKFTSLIQSGMAGGVAAMFKNNQSMMMLAQQTGQIPQLMRIKELSDAGLDVTDAVKEFTSGIANSGLVTSGRLALLAEFDPMFAGMAQEFGNLQMETNSLVQAQEQLRKDAEYAGYGTDVKKYTDDMKAQSDAMSNAQASMARAMTQLNSAFTEIALDVIFPVLIPALDYLSWAVKGISDGIINFNDFLTDLFGGTEGAEFAAGATMLSPLLAYGGYKIGKRLLGGRGTPGIDPTDMIDNVEGPNMGKKSRIGRMLSGLGDGVGGLGRGAGSGIQGTMTGIAEGFKAFGNVRVAAGMAVIAGGLAATGLALSQFANVEWDDMAKAGATLAVIALPLGLFSGFIEKIKPQFVLGSTYLSLGIGILSAGLAAGAYLLGLTLPTLSEGLSGFGDIDGANLVQVGLGVGALGVGLGVLAAGQLLNQLVDFSGWLTSWITEDPVEKLKRFGELAEPLGKAGPALDAFGTAFLNATSKLNVASLNDSVESSMDQIMAILNMDASGTFGGEPPIIGQINSLADAIGKLNRESADLAMGTAGSSASVTSPDMLSPSDLQKRTLAFYDNQRTSNANIIELLRMQNDKLDTLNTSVVDDTNRTVRALKQGGNVVN
jgi:hypothetical protein